MLYSLKKGNYIWTSSSSIIDGTPHYKYNINEKIGNVAHLPECNKKHGVSHAPKKMAQTW